MNTRTTHIKTDKQLVPALRFKEFEGEWFVLNLGKVSDVRDGTHDSPKYYENGFPLVTSKNLLKNGTLDLENVNLITEEDYISINKRSGVEVGDILFGMIGTIGNPVKIKSKGFAIKNVALIKEQGVLINDYLIHYLDGAHIAKQFYIENTGGTQKFISLGVIRQLKVNSPSLPEQQKIASFLSAVDEKIQQLTKKKQLLERYKKGVMQQLFSYDKRLHDGELRKGKLGDFGFFYYGKGAPKTSIVEGAPTPCVRYGELYSTFKEEIKEIKSYTIVDPKDLKLSKGGEVLVPRVGEDPLDFANCSYLPFPDVAIGEMISVYNTEEDGFFMTYYINARLKKQLARMVEGGNVSNLYFRYVEKIEVEIPCVEEQQKIIGFLSSIDTKIEAVNNQITQTQTFKKGLLQQMFI